MRSCLRWLSLVAVAGLVACSGGEAPRSDADAAQAELRSAETRITIIHVNDTHSHLDAEGPKGKNLDGTLGGLAKAATVVEQLRAAEPNSLFVHAGDLFQEDLYFNLSFNASSSDAMLQLCPASAGVPELQLLAASGLDVFTLGNHEFNFTPDVIAGALAIAYPSGQAPVVISNLDYGNASLGNLQPLVKANMIKEMKNGLHVGFFGLVVPDVAEQFRIDGGDPITDPLAIKTDYVGIAQAQVDELRANGADIVVLLSHLGFDTDRDIAKGVDHLDAIIGGHDHLLKYELAPGKAGKVPIAHAGEFYKWVGKLTLAVYNGRVTVADQRFIPVDAKVSRADDIQTEVENLQTCLNGKFQADLFHAPLATAPFPIAKDAWPENPWRDTGIGNLITDALRHAGGSEIALTVNGLFTEGLPWGRLVPQDAYRIVGDGFDTEEGNPFGMTLGFPLYRLHFPGLVLWGLIEGALEESGDIFPQVSGMRYAFNPNAAPRLVALFVQGQPLDMGQTYSVTINAGLREGLKTRIEDLGIPYQMLNEENLDTTEYDAVRDWMDQLGWLFYTPQGRILDISKL